MDDMDVVFKWYCIQEEKCSRLPLGEYVDGSLSKSRHIKMKQHIAGCVMCQQTVRAVREAVRQFEGGYRHA